MCYFNISLFVNRLSTALEMTNMFCDEDCYEIINDFYLGNVEERYRTHLAEFTDDKVLLVGNALLKSSKSRIRCKRVS